MIDVRMRIYGLNQARIERKVVVALLGFFAASLIHSAIQQIPFSICLEMVHGAGDGLSRSPKSQFHEGFAA